MGAFLDLHLNVRFAHGCCCVRCLRAARGVSATDSRESGSTDSQALAARDSFRTRFLKVRRTRLSGFVDEASAAPCLPQPGGRPARAPPRRGQRSLASSRWALYRCAKLTLRAKSSTCGLLPIISPRWRRTSERYVAACASRRAKSRGCGPLVFTRRPEVGRLWADERRVRDPKQDYKAYWPDQRRSRDRDACLLYTSPSPRDRQKSRMPSSA